MLLVAISVGLICGGSHEVLSAADSSFSLSLSQLLAQQLAPLNGGLTEHTAEQAARSALLASPLHSIPSLASLARQLDQAADGVGVPVVPPKPTPAEACAACAEAKRCE